METLTNAVQNFMQGQQWRQQQDQRKQGRQDKANFGQMLMGNDSGNLMETNPQMFMQGQQYLQGQQDKKRADQAKAYKDDEDKQMASIQSTSLAAQQLKNMPKTQWLTFLTNRSEGLKGAGIDTQQTDQAIAMVEAGDYDGLSTILDGSIAMGEKAKAYMSRAGQGKTFQPVYETDADGNVSGFIPRVSPSGEFTRIEMPVGEGKSFMKSTIQKKADVEVDKDLKKKQNVERVNINKTYRENAAAAASELPALNKLIETLPNVRTGAFAKQLLAVRKTLGSDVSKEEAFLALSNKLVLKAAESIKGALSDADLQILKDTTASLGNSMEGNMLILKTLKSLAKNTINTFDDFKIYRKDGDVLDFVPTRYKLDQPAAQPESQTFGMKEDAPLQLTEPQQQDQVDFSSLSEADLMRMIEEEEAKGVQ